VGKGASETRHRGLACSKCLFDIQVASRARGLRVRRPGGQPPSHRSASCRPETPGCLTGAPRARPGGKPQEGRGSGDGSPDRSEQRSPVAQAGPVLSGTRRSRSACGKAGGSAGHAGSTRALERRNPRRATTRRRGGSPAGNGLIGRSKTLQLRRTVIFQIPQSGGPRLLGTAREERRREAHGCPKRSKAL
jgi:hypothetical protein